MGNGNFLTAEETERLWGEAVGRIEEDDEMTENYYDRVARVAGIDRQTAKTVLLAAHFSEEPLPVSFQQRVHAWVCDFFPEHGVNVPERSRRFIEEALELVQATGLEAQEVWRLVDRVYSRPAGEPVQELGGSMVSLAALAEALHLDAGEAGEAELRRISAPGMRERMRARQAEKRAEGVGE